MLLILLLVRQIKWFLFLTISLQTYINLTHGHVVLYEANGYLLAANLASLTKSVWSELEQTIFSLFLAWMLLCRRFPMFIVQIWPNVKITLRATSICLLWSEFLRAAVWHWWDFGYLFELVFSKTLSKFGCPLMAFVYAFVGAKFYVDIDVVALLMLLGVAVKRWRYPRSLLLRTRACERVPIRGLHHCRLSLDLLLSWETPKRAYAIDDFLVDLGE